MQRIRDAVVEFVREHPDCTVTDITEGVGIEGGTAWLVLCRADEPDFPIYSTSGGSITRGPTWRFRVREVASR
jgi:hypothetical protein